MIHENYIPHSLGFHSHNHLLANILGRQSKATVQSDETFHCTPKKEKRDINKMLNCHFIHFYTVKTGYYLHYFLSSYTSK